MEWIDTGYIMRETYGLITVLDRGRTDADNEVLIDPEIAEFLLAL